MQITPSCLVNKSKKKNSVQKRTQQGCRATERPVSQMADLIVCFLVYMQITPFGLVNMFEKIKFWSKTKPTGPICKDLKE